MTCRARFVVLVGLLLTLVGGLGLLSSRWLVYLGLDLPELLWMEPNRLNREEEREADLSEVKCQIAIKHRITREVIEGRTTLPYAAALFRYLNEHGRRPYRASPWVTCDTPEERACQEVILWVHGGPLRLRAGDGSWAVRLEEELEQFLDTSGRLRLPTVTAEDIPELNSRKRSQ